MGAPGLYKRRRRFVNYESLRIINSLNLLVDTEDLHSSFNYITNIYELLPVLLLL